jgi:hypothetical protein
LNGRTYLRKENLNKNKNITERRKIYLRDVGNMLKYIRQKKPEAVESGMRRREREDKNEGGNGFDREFKCACGGILRGSVGAGQKQFSHYRQTHGSGFYCFTGTD